MEILKTIRLIELVYLSPMFTFFIHCTEYPIGAIFDKKSIDIKYAFEKQIDFLNSQRDGIELRPEIQELESTDSFAVSNAICSLLKRGVFGIIGVSDASALSTIQSYSNTFKVPFIALSMTQNSTNHGQFMLFMRPVYMNGLLDVILRYGWERVLYIYDTDEGLIRLQQLFQAVNIREHSIDIDVKRVADVQSCYLMLKDLHQKNDKAEIRVFLDIPTERAEQVIVKLKNDTSVYNHKYHFLLGELRMEEMDLQPFQNGGINVTGFQLLNYTRLLKTSAREEASFREWKKWEWPDIKDSNKISLEPALVIDAVDLFVRALKQLNSKQFYPYNVLGRSPNMQNVKCTDSSYVSPNNGTNMMEILKGSEVEFNGLTGKVSFDDNGFRDKFKLHLFDITMNMGLAEVGFWTRETGLRTQEPYRRKSGVDDKNRTRIVTSILESPYVEYKDEETAKRQPLCGMENLKGFCIDLARAIEQELNIKFNMCLRADKVYGELFENGTWSGMLGQLVRQDSPYLMYVDEETKARAPRCGKENFVGFCADLAKKVAEIVEFDYNICIVKDGKYGEKLPNETWNGMIGELTRDEVDLAIAPMTITSQRERFVDFTKPFMSLGISIMIKKTQVKKASVFSFMDPLSYEIWMCILFAYIGVSVVLFLVSRFSPTEWHVDEGTSIKNDFTISNSLWYSLGAFMQQGCDISPRSVSGRIVGSVWWFFTLIIISSYTANLAAFLTVERMLTPIESAEDLAKQTEIQYGILGSGSTKAFFQQSKFPVHERMWAYMQSASPSVFVSTNAEGINRVRKGNYAFLIESTTNEYNNMRKPCDTMKVGTNLDSKGYGIATPIGSDLRDQLTLAVLKLREAGTLEDMQKNWWERKSECPHKESSQLTLAVLKLREAGTLEDMRKEWWERKSECPVKESSQDGGQAELNLENVAGIFYILVAGLTLSVIIAFMEFIYKSKIDSKRSKKSFGSVLRCKARLSFRGSLDRDGTASGASLRKSMSTYTYTGPSHVAGTDGFPDNLHTQV